ncbi:protein MFI-like [Dipodomys merriami]|uniref:protein MFI-like n=1 Tax=Dipodomys merriami TaxID=94247 RepID=UPI00385582B4
MEFSTSETESEVTQEDTLSSVKEDGAARVIQSAWKCFVNACIFQHIKNLIDLRRQGEPRQIVRFINPKEAELLDAAAGIHVRFRLGGMKFPPEIYYKIFTHRHVEDLCANSPRDYTKLVAKHLSHNKNDRIQDTDRSGWYRRVENNGWRPVSERFWLPTDNEILESQKETEFHFSKLKRRQDIEKKRKIKKIEWMKQMYYAGTLAAKTSNNETIDLIHTATEGLIRTIEEGGVDSVMEWEVDEVLNWTNTLNFDEYIANWKQIATSNSSVNFQGFRFDQTPENLNQFEDIPKAQRKAPYNNVYGKPIATSRITSGVEI